MHVMLHTQRGYLANLLLLKESQVLELYSMFITKNWYLKSFSGDVFHLAHKKDSKTVCNIHVTWLRVADFFFMAK